MGEADRAHWILGAQRRRDQSELAALYCRTFDLALDARAFNLARRYSSLTSIELNDSPAFTRCSCRFKPLFLLDMVAHVVYNHPIKARDQTRDGTTNGESEPEQAHRAENQTRREIGTVCRRRLSVF